MKTKSERQRRRWAALLLVIGAAMVAVDPLAQSFAGLDALGGQQSGEPAVSFEKFAQP